MTPLYFLIGICIVGPCPYSIYEGGGGTKEQCEKQRDESNNKKIGGAEWYCAVDQDDRKALK